MGGTLGRILLGLAMAATARPAAEDGPGVRIWKGEITEWNVRGPAGDFVVLDKSTLRRCRVSQQTYMTRETLRVNYIGVRVGDFVEVVADLREGESRCSALTIYIKPMERTAKQAAKSPYVVPVAPGLLDNLFPRGLMTLTGIVSKLEETRLTLWTRGQRNMIFSLRPDTIYSSNGRPVGQEDLPLRTRVFLRAGRSFEGELEVYQVVWGEILFPNRP